MTPSCRGIAIAVAVAAWLTSWMGSPAWSQPTVDLEAYELNFSKGVLAFQHERYEEATGLLAAALAAKPGDEDARYYLGLIALRLNRPDDAARFFQAILDSHPESGHGRLGLGMVAYRRQRYDDAVQFLSEAAKRLPDEALVHFYLGLVYHAKEDFDKSPGQFLRAMTLSRDLAPSAHYYTGVAFFKRGVLDEATDALQEVVAMGEPDSELVRSARHMLEQIGQVAPRGPKPWDVLLSATVQYDTNVVLLPLGTSPPGGTTGISRKDDVRHTLYLRSEYRPLQTDRSIIGLAYSVYQSYHSTLSNFDVENHTPTLFVQRQWGMLQARMQYALDYVKVGPSPYLIAHNVLPSLIVNEGGWTYTQIQLRYQSKDFQHGLFLQNSLRDGNNYLAGITQYILFANKTGSVRIGYTYDRDRTGGGRIGAATPGIQSATDWSYDGHLVSGGVAFPPVVGIRLDLAFDYYRQRYLNPSSFSPDGLTHRRDDIYFATTTVTKELTDTLSLSVQYSYTRDQNNLAAFDYTRSIASIAVAGRF